MAAHLNCLTLINFIIYDFELYVGILLKIDAGRSSCENYSVFQPILGHTVMFYISGVFFKSSVHLSYALIMKVKC